MTHNDITRRLDAALAVHDSRVIEARTRLLHRLDELPPDAIAERSDALADYERALYSLLPACTHESLIGGVTC